MVTQQAPPKRKRGRPSNASKAAEAAARAQAEAEAEPDNESRPSKRGRTNTAAAPALRQQTTSRPTGAGAQRSSVANLLRGPNPNPRVAMDEPGEQSTSRPRGGGKTRPSLGDVAPAEAQNKSARRRSDGTGGKRGGARKSTGASRTAATTTAKKRIPQPQSGPGAAASRRRDESDSPDEPSFMRPRPGDDEEEEDNEGGYPPSPPKPYTHVAAHTRRVRKSTIDTKWSQLGSGSTKAVASILQLANRPILQRLSNSELRRKHTADILRIVHRRITEKVSHLPFPPASLPTRTKPGRPRGGRAEQDGGRETELNFESVLDAKQTLERQLDPVLHAVELLGGEVERMEAEVERDYEMLRGLEAQARSQARENRGLLKNAHPLAPSEKKGETSGGGGGGGANEGDVAFEPMDDTGNPFEDMQNRQLRSVVAQLGVHTDSLLADQQQTDGVGVAMSHTRATLQALLAQRLGADAYERVVLGS